ncbi:MAG: hypothetical protein ACLQRM_11770 [Acidimicrobiales bacterium]
MQRLKKLKGLVGLLLLTSLIMAWDGDARAVINKLPFFGGGPRALYTFPAFISPDRAPGQVNLLSDPSFENAKFKICTFKCKANSGWSLEHFSLGEPTAYRTRTGAVTGSFAEALVYHGHKGDNGIHKDIELYQGARSPGTTAGHKLTFTLWVSGSCTRCIPFIGIESFNTRYQYLGESDQFFSPPALAQAVQVSYLLPIGTVRVAAYIQVPELYSFSNVRLYLDDASLVVEPGRFPAPEPTYR